MKTAVLFFLLVLSVQVYSQKEPLLLKGKIGSYSIEMMLEQADYETGEFSGKYRYAGKDKYLSLSGVSFGNCLVMDEYYKKDTTGAFWLAFADGKLEGRWIGGQKGYEVSLNVIAGNISVLDCKQLEDYTASTTDDITGSYGTDSYWVNDYFYTDDFPQCEIGFNGGYAIIEEFGNDSIQFAVQVICGPTYHFAIASGMAYKKGKKYIFTENFDEEGEDCVIEIWFDDHAVHMQANQSFQCGFGARAYLEHDFVKISDKADFVEDSSIGQILENR